MSEPSVQRIIVRARFDSVGFSTEEGGQFVVAEIPAEVSIPGHCIVDGDWMEQCGGGWTCERITRFGSDPFATSALSSSDASESGSLSGPLLTALGTVGAANRSALVSTARASLGRRNRTSPKRPLVAVLETKPA